MYKIFFILFLLFASYTASAQYIINSSAYSYKGLLGRNSLQLPQGCGVPVTSINAPDSSQSAFYWDSCGEQLYAFSPKTQTWILIQAVSSNTGDTIAGGPFVTENIHIGFDPGTNLTASQLITQVWYGTKPVATLTGGTMLEFTSASTVNQTLNWSAKRQPNAVTLATIVVAGIAQTFVQPAQGATVSGTQSVDVPANTTTTYQNVVTATDGQSATASTTFTFLGRKYYGIVSDTAGIGSGSQDAVILALNNDFATTRALNTSTGTVTGIKFFVYAYPASLGSLSGISFNSIPAIEAMNTVTRSFTNSLGYTQNYILYWNKQGQTTNSDITAQ